MNCCRKIGIVGLAACCLTGNVAARAFAAGRENAGDVRPNILLICVEDMSPHMSCYGETSVQTPNIDRLANTGARFTRAFVTAPVCSPSRSAVITGMYQTTIGAHHHRSSRGAHEIHLPDGVVPLPVLFQQAGFHTSLGGLPRNRPGQAALGKSDYNFVWVESMYDGSDWAGRRPGQPFFAQIQLRGGKNRGARVPHPVDPADVKLPPYYPDHPVLRKDWAGYLNSVIHTDIEVGEILERLEDEGIAQKTAVFFWTDHGISHVRDKQFLYDGGIHVPLIIRAPGRVGPGIKRTDLVSHIDVAATSLDWAGIAVPASMQGRPLFGAGYTPRRFVFAARDRCDETVDRIRCVRDERFKYIRNFHADRSHTQPNRYKDNKPIMIAMRALFAAGELNEWQARPFLPMRPPEELYDLRQDPHEMQNLAESTEHAATLARMRTALDEWMETTGDCGRVPESDDALKAAAAFRSQRRQRPADRAP